MSDHTVNVSARVRPGGMSWTQDVLPFASSLMLHALIVAFGILSYKAYQIVKAPALPEEVVIPVSDIITNQPPGSIPNVGLNDNPLIKAMQDTTPEGDKDWAPKKGPTIDITRAGGGAGDSSDVLLTVGPGGGFKHGDAGRPGTGGINGPGDGDDSGPLGAFGPSIGGAFGPASQAFIPGGPSGNARTIIYVCDGTGSMINKIAQLKIELSRSVQNLTPIQSFNIVFYQDDKVLKLDNNVMVANPENKRKAEAWLGDIVAVGTTDPVPAMKFALAARPQLMYFLTDAADFPDVAAVQNVFHKFNADHKTKVNTILFVESETEKQANKQSEPLMSGIAGENGGIFRWVTLDRLH